jgi:hypothetical protein
MTDNSSECFDKPVNRFGLIESAAKIYSIFGIPIMTFRGFQPSGDSFHPERAPDEGCTSLEPFHYW